MKSKNMSKPNILIHFDGDTCIWFSDGWKDDKQLMKEAKYAINAGNDPDEVRKILSQSFNVVEAQ